MTLPYINNVFPIVKDDGTMQDAFRLFIATLSETQLTIGSGTPEGVIVRPQGSFYMDEDGLTGAILFIKQATDIAGDDTQGWVAI